MTKRKIVFMIIATFLLLAVVFAIIDISRARGGEAPLFCISTDSANFVGLGYGFYIEYPPAYTGTNIGSYIFYIFGIPVVNTLIN